MGRECWFLFLSFLLINKLRANVCFPPLMKSMYVYGAHEMQAATLDVWNLVWATVTLNTYSAQVRPMWPILWLMSVMLVRPKLSPVVLSPSVQGLGCSNNSGGRLVFVLHFYFSTIPYIIPFLSTMSSERELEADPPSNSHTQVLTPCALPTQESLSVLLCPGLPRFMKLLF